MSKRRHIKFWRYYKEWIETYKDGQIQDVTYAKYLMIQKQIKNLAPDLYLDEMTRRDVQRLINKYGETHERTTVLDFLHHIQAPLRDAVYEGWIAKDPTYKVVATSHKKHKKTRNPYLEKDEVDKLVDVFQKDGSWLADMCDFDLRTGLRYAEVLGLTPKDVDLQRLTVYVNKTWDYKTGEGFKKTKNVYSNRVITIDWRAAQDIQKHLDGVKPDESIFVKAFIDSPDARKPRSGKVYNSIIDTWITAKCKEAGVPRITFHNLRHTHASLLITAGVSIQSVAARLGHADTTTTQKTYIHLLDELKARDNNKMMTALTSLGG